jgi:hypothetical protein
VHTKSQAKHVGEDDHESCVRSHVVVQCMLYIALLFDKKLLQALTASQFGGCACLQFHAVISKVCTYRMCIRVVLAKRLSFNVRVHMCRVFTAYRNYA